MYKLLRPAIVLFFALTVVTGIAYPLLVTGVAQILFPAQAGGSLIQGEGGVAGSALIGQPFDDPKYFWGRLSATPDFPYNSASSSGSNLGPTNPALVDEVKARVDALQKADPDNKEPIPVDLVTSSGSGLDPEITPAAALYQAARVARARNLPEEKVRALIEQYTEPRQLGFLGELRVNVVRLNRGLDGVEKGGK